jgi:Phosphopantetheine attachment site
MRILTFPLFASALVAALDIELPGEPQESSQLVADLGFDSMLFVAALGVIEQMGATVDDQQLVRTTTLGEAYQLYAVGVVAHDDGLETLA